MANCVGSERLAHFSVGGGSPFSDELMRSVGLEVQDAGFLQQAHAKVQEIGQTFGSASLAASMLTEKEAMAVAVKFVKDVKKVCGQKGKTELSEMESKFVKELNKLDRAEVILVGDKKVVRLSRELGAGAEGAVSLGITAEGKMCAIKNCSQIGQEAAILRDLGASDAIVKLYAADDRFIVLEHCRYALEDFSFNKDDLPFLNRYNIQLLDALYALYEHKIIHTDIKEDNIRIGNGSLKLLDFNSAIHEGEPGIGGTIGYYAPEQLALFWQITAQTMKEHVPGYENLELIGTPNIILTHKVDVWQMMLVLAKINRSFLTQPFQDRIGEYMSWHTACCQGARMNFGSAKWLEDSGFSFMDFKKQFPNEYDRWILQYYMGKAFQSFPELMNGRSGLFSDLTPTTPLEALLMDMSSIDSKERMDAGKIHQYLQPFMDDMDGRSLFERFVQ